MSQRDKVLLAVIAVVAVLAGGWFTVVAPKRREATELSQRISLAQSQLQEATSLLAQERAARAQLRGDTHELVAAGRALPTQVAMPAILRGLEHTATHMGVQMTTLTTSQGASTGTGSSTSTGAATPGVTPVNLSLTFNGRFLDLQRFLQRLQRFVRVSRQRVRASGRLLSISSVKLTRGQGTGLTASVSATVYVLQPPSGQAGVASTPGASSSTPTSTASAQVPR